MSYKNIFTDIYENFGFGSTESRSGPGSTLYETKNIRQKIVEICKSKNLRSVVDIPCGDFNWFKEIVHEFDSYLGGDIVKNCISENNRRYKSDAVEFIEFDILSDEIPFGDILVVRDIIGHFPIEDGIKIVENILKSKCKYLLSTTWYNVNDKNYYLYHKNHSVNYGRFYPVNLMSEPFNFSEPDFIIEEDVMVDDYEKGNRKILGLWDIEKLKIHLASNSSSEKSDYNSKLTFVTGLWDISRATLSDSWARDFNHYLDKLRQLLNIDANLIIFGDDNLESFVNKHRNPNNTQFIKRDLNWIKSTVPFEKIQNIRKDPKWFNQSSWLTESTQAKLEYYNPLVMSKMFLLNDASILDKFDSSHLFWIDAGITNTVHPGYFTHDKIHLKFDKLFNKFGFICFPYDAHNEIHGFSYPQINQYAGEDVKLVCRGGLFGGKKDYIRQMNSIYYNILNETINDGFMGTEESVFSIMLYKHPQIVDYVQINSNGLISKFCEDVKNDDYIVLNTEKIENEMMLNVDKVGLYVITFNSPKQFENLITSMIRYDENFIKKTHKFLLDNSSDPTTFEEYSNICQKYNFEHIKKDNLGICGGRQWIAEHFEGTELDYYLFFEDDMFFYDGKEKTCKNGFTRFFENLFTKSMEIMRTENFDFLKLNYTEFFGDNGTQWSWYNVPQNIREKFWPNKTKLPKIGLDPNAPKTIYKNIQSYEGVPYVTGEIYYSNWPQIVSRFGNRKMFLETKWSYPYEQTWMSHMFQLTKEGILNPGLILGTPTEHDRFDHYDRNLRKES